MKSFDADVCMMAYVLLFVPQPVLDTPRFGTFQYHPSLLPAHRGPSSINWPIAMGKTRTGLSIFWPNEGLDEGPILIQKSVDVGPDETLGDVYFKKLFPMGVDAMIEGLELVRAGCVLKHAQNLAHGSYEGWFKKQVAEIDWSKPVAEVYNLIRAANPAPGAWGTIRGAKVDIFDSAKIVGKGDGDGAPGRVLAVTDQGMTIAAQGGAIVAKRVRGADGKKVAAAEWAKAAGVLAGDTFDKPAPKS
jgi:methionyl-tRNA formyltransferase